LIKHQKPQPSKLQYQVNSLSLGIQTRSNIIVKKKNCMEQVEIMVMKLPSKEKAKLTTRLGSIQVNTTLSALITFAEQNAI